MRAWLLGRLSMSERPHRTYRLQRIIILTTTIVLDYAVTLMLGALATSIMFHLNVESYLLAGILLCVILYAPIHFLRKTRELRIRRKKYSPIVIVPCSSEGAQPLEFSANDLLKDAKALIRVYLNKVPGVSVKSPVKLPVVWFLPQEEVDSWNLVLTGDAQTFVRVRGLHLNWWGLAIVSKEGPYHKALVATIHELIHGLTNNEAEALYITAAILYLADRKSAFGYADALLRSNPAALKLWPH